MKKGIITLAVLAAILAIGIFLFAKNVNPSETQNNNPSESLPTEQNQNTDENTSPQESEPQEEPVPEQTGQHGQPEIISLTELSLHNSEQDCWIAYEGDVYDITSFLPKHPGGKNRIIPYCGTEMEFTTAFERQHGESQVSRLKQEGEFQGDLAQ